MENKNIPEMRGFGFMRNAIKSCLVLCLILGLSSCGSKKEAGAEKESVKNEQSSEISITSEVTTEVTEPDIPEVIEIDMFENVEFVDYFDSETYREKGMEGEYNVYPIIGYFSVEKNPYWSEYLESLDEDEREELSSNQYNFGYVITDQSVTPECETIKLEFLDVYNKFDEFLNTHGYVISSTSKVYTVDAADKTTAIISEDIYTDKIASEAEKIINEKILSDYPEYEIIKKSLVVAGEEYHFTSNAGGLIGDARRTYTLATMGGVRLECKNAGSPFGLVYTLKNSNSGQYLNVTLNMIVKGDKILKTKFESLNDSEVNPYANDGKCKVIDLE